MKFDKLDINIKDYLGRIGPGITVVLSIIYQTKVYEGMYWYTDEVHVLEIPNEIENDIGKIEEYSEYKSIMDHLKEITADYKEIAPQLKDIFNPENPDQNDQQETSQ